MYQLLCKVNLYYISIAAISFFIAKPKGKREIVSPWKLVNLVKLISLFFLCRRFKFDITNLQINVLFY